MVKMKVEKNVKQRILNSALKEFSCLGYSGARMERIAKNAKINKAMLFYYFSSKKNLYQQVVRGVFQKIFPLVMQLVSSQPTAEEFFEKLPGLYVDFASKNPQFMPMVMMELIQNPKNITSILSEYFKDNVSKGLPGPPQLIKLIKKWHSENKITEKDPMQFMLNIVSLSLLSILAKPFLDALFNLAPPEIITVDFGKDDFYKKRIESIINLLKRGMLA